MPAGTYFKQAAADLRNAMVELRRDIENKRRAITEGEREMQRRKSELAQDKRIKESATSSTAIDDQQRASLLREAHDDLTQITNMERDFMRERDRLLQEIAQAEADIVNLEGQARNYESRQNQ